MVMNKEQIKEYLPHRKPFLFVDSVLEIVEKERIVAEKIFAQDEFFFPGHFPGYPIVPGVILTEAMAQTGGILVNYSFKDELENSEYSNAFLMGLDKCKFRKPVVPDEKVVFEVKLVKRRSRILQFEGIALVNDRKVAEAQISASLV